MDSFKRIVRLHSELRQRRGPVSARVLQERLECSRPTFFRVLAHLRDELGAPVINSPGRGYFYDRNQPEFELPGFWLSADELRALLAMDELVAQIEPGVLHEHVRPLRTHIEQLLAKSNRTRQPFPTGRVRLLRQHARRAQPPAFVTVSSALLEGCRLRITYRDRARGRRSERDVSPQRLVLYRDNWYLDAWCHQADDLRTFSLDRIAAASTLEDNALVVPQATLDEVVGAAYGIFAGPATGVAKLLFTAVAARWVADETWHPGQSGQFHTDGSYELHVPYGDPRELLRDILRYGADVRVLAPRSLVRQVRDALAAALGRYDA
jgi:predicted DNA-binding transcriptional regulator YafY